MATTTLIDGFKDQSGGMDASRSPEVISEKHFALGVNVVARDGMLSTRPMFKRVELPVSAAVRAGYFQGGIGYNNHASGVKLILAVFDGRVYSIDPVALVATDLSAASSLVNDSAAPHYFCDVEGTLVISNGRDGALLFDGVKLRRASTDEVPTCTIMAFGQGRLVAVSPDKREFVMGDLAYGGSLASIPITLSSPVTSSNTTRLTTTKPHGFTTGDTVTIRRHYTTPPITGTWTITVTGDTTFTIPVTLQAGSSGGEVLKSNEGQANDALRFTEWKFANERGVFRLPSKFGPITAAVFFPVQDTGTGQGDLLVAGQSGACGFPVSQPRETWLNIQMQREALTEIGFAGHLAHAQVNGDIFFASRDGLRSYRNARAEFGQYGNTPLSAEIHALLSDSPRTARQQASMALHDNRLLFTASPRVLATTSVDAPQRCIWQSFAALDFQQSSRISKDALAAYDGIWTGLDALQLVPCKFGDEERLYVFCWQQTQGGAGRENQLWEITTRHTGYDAWADCDGIANHPLIRSNAELRAFDFGEWKQEKRLTRLDAWLDDIRGNYASVTTYWRPDLHGGGWFKWGLSEISPALCALEVDSTITGCTDKRPQVRPPFHVPPMRLGTPPTYEDKMTNRLADRGYTFQVRLDWYGRLRIKKLLAYAEPLVEPTQGDATSRALIDQSTGDTWPKLLPPVGNDGIYLYDPAARYLINPEPACVELPCVNVYQNATTPQAQFLVKLIGDDAGPVAIQFAQSPSARVLTFTPGVGYTLEFLNGFVMAKIVLSLGQSNSYMSITPNLGVPAETWFYAGEGFTLLPTPACIPQPWEISLDANWFQVLP